jgi:thiamine biosynthesis lipoprotein
MNFFRQTFQAMGTPCEIQMFTKQRDLAEHTAASVIADVLRLEARYSRYRNDSFLSQINRVAASGGEIKVDPETAGLLDYAATCYVQSDGLFDISSGILRKAWRFDAGQLPDQEFIEKLLQYVGWQRLEWRSPMLVFPQPGIELDFGGIVKEYAVDRAAALCANAGVRHGLVNLGGDIKIIGPRPDGSLWQIGVANPHQKRSVMKTLSIPVGAIASSGDYERCIELDGKRFGHVLNPKTGWPVNFLAAVTVLADFCVVAGSASTITMLKETEGPAWLSAMNLPHFWVDVDGNVGGSLVND